MLSRSRRTATVAVLVGLLVGVLAAPAFAHVTVRTDNPQPEGFAVYTVRVPNESDTASTTMVEVQMPEGLDASRYEPVPGWDISLEDGVLIAEGGEIAPGEFRDFRFQARNPAEPGDLAFPAVQTYSDGEVVSWTGDPDSDTPASIVTIGADADGGTTAQADHATEDGAAAGDGAAEDGAAAGDGAAEDGAAAEDGTVAAGDMEPASDVAAGGTDALTITALVVAVLALLGAGFAVAQARRTAA